MAAQLSDVADKAFDYVIVGGGTAGLTIAARLLEHTDNSVLVLEAGEPNLDDPKILLGGGWGSTVGDSKYDWAFMTTPQVHCNNRQMLWSRGKGLGGSSAMNFYAWIKPPAADIDAWEELGNSGWNWKTYMKYTLRAEGFTAASEDQLKEYAHTHNIEYRGQSGPIKTTVPVTPLQINKFFLEAAQKQGLPLLEDAYGGNTAGCWEGSANLDRKSKWTRSYAATAYYLPHKDNPKFKVLTEAIGAKVLFGDAKDGDDLIATGVEFIHDGRTYKAHAKKEVILAAGALKSPQLLELSGVGRRDVLDKVGVPLKLELPGVGENLQDHTFVGISYELDPNVSHKTADLFRNPEFAKEQVRLQDLDQENLHRLGITAFGYVPLQLASPNGSLDIVDKMTAYVEEKKKSGALPPGLAEQWDIQLRVLKDPTLPDVEVIAFPAWLTFVSQPEPGKCYLTTLCVTQHQFSRGSVHSKNNDPLEQPDIDPNTFSVPYDLDVFVENVKFARRLAETEPFKSGIVREVDPGATAKTDEEIKEYLRKCCNTCYHACGSLSMLPRKKNGVVDPKLKVYGTKNLRVADMSIVPLEVAAHTQATAYYVGEYMADILTGAA
ncbi:GMC oxidoreductase [Daedalea quercina L-15889]|uniref:GMC oxidoreductase n=1 Tax=Daedalea quercina L-15889 TaxID=1314783 RepID=A0A165T6B9_9APHY|nr:GMC oxidoreductase [Daedalea quercina L-15889]